MCYVQNITGVQCFVNLTDNRTSDKFLRTIDIVITLHQVSFKIIILVMTIAIFYTLTIYVINILI